MNPIVMPFLDCASMTDQAIQDAVNQTLPHQILLVDNGSQPPARMMAEKWARTLQGEILLWQHDPPFNALGALWNRALRFCWEAGADHAFVVNNDVRLHRETYEVLLEAMHATQAWFITGVSVTEAQFDPELDLRAAVGLVTDARKDGVKPAGYSYGGPDFSCYLISRECHRWFQFDEGFIPAYHEDNDYHRRLQLAGLGDRIFGVNIPFLHYGSGTLKDNPQLRERWPARFAACQQYYAQKWGGLPGQETFLFPHEAGLTPESVEVYTGQGRRGHWLPAPQGGYPWVADSTN